MNTTTAKIAGAGNARAAIALGLCAAACLSATVISGPASALTSGAVAAKVHYACSAPNSATVPCHFSTPSGNIRCLWTPSPNSVACERVANGRGYRLRPTGRAKAIKLKLKLRGETLPRSQQVEFPESLSCHDTNATMTCNQNFGTGEFELSPHGGHSA
jgi:hypothetical protein